MDLPVYNQQGEKTGMVHMPEGVFGVKWNADLVHQVVTSMRANMRTTIADARERWEVRGGGRKPWRQKGTGRARHGSIRSPLWKGGGVTHGPTADRNFKKKVNKKMAKAALYAVLSAKARDGEVVVMDDMKFEEPKTKHPAKVFRQLSRQEELGKMTRSNGVLVVLPAWDEGTVRALRNLPYVGIDQAKNLNALEVLQYRYVLFPKETVEGFTGTKKSKK